MKRTDYLLLLFHSPDERIVTRTRTRDPHHGYCQICVRKYINKFIYTEYENTTSIIGKDWSGIKSLNIGGIMPYDDIYFDLLNIDELKVDEIWILSHDISLGKSSTAIIENLGVDYRKIFYRQYANIHSNPLSMFRFNNMRELINFLKHFSNKIVYSDMMIIGWSRLPNEYFGKVELKEGADLFLETYFANSKNIDSFLQIDDKLESYWRLSIKVDCSIFDTFDPIYCVKNHDINTILNNVINKVCNIYKCELHLMPMINSIMKNWFGYFEIPIIKQDDFI